VNVKNKQKSAHLLIYSAKTRYAVIREQCHTPKLGCSWAPIQCSITSTMFTTLQNAWWNARQAGWSSCNL